ncbi:MAG: heme-binding domain-containing protein [Bacteroidota bacterium]
MKKILILNVLVFGALFFMNFNNVPESKMNPQNDKYEVPEDIQAIIDKSCKGCHVTDSKNMKGKAKLNWDKMKNVYKTPKVIGKLMDIEETVKENKMPPKKFLSKYPDKNLSTKNKEKLQKWAKDMATKLAE